MLTVAADVSGDGAEIIAAVERWSRGTCRSSMVRGVPGLLRFGPGKECSNNRFASWPLPSTAMQGGYLPFMGTIRSLSNSFCTNYSGNNGSPDSTAHSA